MSDLENLYAVQVLDSTVEQLTYKRAHLDERVAVAEARKALATVKALATANADRQRALEGRYVDLERQSRDVEARQTRLETQLRTIVVTREAEALQRQIATLRAEHEGADDEGLMVLEEMESLATAADRLGDDVAAGVQAEGSVVDALRAAEADLDRQIAEIRSQRAAAVATVPADLVDRYEHMRPRFKGIAVAKLDGHRCSGCHLDLSRVELEAIWAGMAKGEVAECPQCARLLVK